MDAGGGTLDSGAQNSGPPATVSWSVTSGPGRNIDLGRITGLAAIGGSLLISGVGAPGGAANVAWIARHAAADGAFEPSFAGQGWLRDDAMGSAATVLVAGDLYELASTYSAGQRADPPDQIRRRSTDDGTTTASAAVTAPEHFAFDLISDGVALYGSAHFLDFMSQTSSGLIEKRGLDLSLIQNFGNNGRITTGGVAVLAIDGGALFVIERRGTGSWEWRLSKYDATTGQRDVTFGEILLAPAETGGPHLEARGGSIYIASSDISRTVVRIEKRSAIDGGLDPMFGSGGVVSWSGGEVYSGDLALDGDTLYVSRTSSTGEDQSSWELQARSAVSGALDPTFAPNGTVSQSGRGRQRVDRILIEGPYIYLGIIAQYSNLGSDALLVKIGTP